MPHERLGGPALPKPPDLTIGDGLTNVQAILDGLPIGSTVRLEGDDFQGQSIDLLGRGITLVVAPGAGNLNVIL